jgi:phytanoyl-CoA hydroxylase
MDVESFQRDGFFVIRQLLPAGELAELVAQLDRYIRQVVPTLSEQDAFYQDRSRPESLKQLHRMGQDSFFETYRDHPRWRQVAETLLGEPAHAEEPEWFNKPPGTVHVTPPHQDNYYFCLAPPHVLTIWLALDDVDAVNGCLRYVAGSHLRGFRPHNRSNILGFSQGITDYSPDDFGREVAVSLRAGDAVAHHGMTIHRADANLSPSRERRSFAMVFKGVSCRRDDEAFARYTASARQQHQELGLTT